MAIFKYTGSGIILALIASIISYVLYGRPLSLAILLMMVAVGAGTAKGFDSR